MNFLFILFVSAKFLSHYNRETCDINRIVDTIIATFTISVFIFGFVLFMYGLIKPQDAMFIGYLIPSSVYSFFPFGLILGIFQGHIILIAVTNISLCGGAVIVYLWYLAVLYTRELHLDQPPKKYKADPKVRSDPKNLRHVYRSLQVFNEIVMELAGQYGVMCHVAFIVLPTIGNFALIRYWDQLQILVIVLIIGGLTVMAVFWMFVLQVGKYLYVRGQKILLSWKRTYLWKGKGMEYKAMKKFAKGSRLILLRYRNILVFKRVTQLIYIKCVMRGTFKALLAIHKH